jgi:hypothetical protein
MKLTIRAASLLWSVYFFPFSAGPALPLGTGTAPLLHSVGVALSSGRWDAPALPPSVPPSVSPFQP